MPNRVNIEVTATDAGATRVIDNVSASVRKARSDSEAAGRAQALAAKYAGDAVSEQSRRIVQAQDEQRAVAKDLAQISAAARKGSLDEATAINAKAAAYQRLTLVQKEAAEAQRKQVGAHEYLRTSIGGKIAGVGEEFGISEGMTVAAGGIAVAAVAVGELAGKMKEAVESSLEFGEAMKHASEKTGLATETLSVLKYAAETTGGDFDSMTAAVGKMDKTIAQATEGNKKAEAYMKALGLDAKELANSPQGAEIAFKRLAQVLSETENPIRRVELASGVMSKAGNEQIAMLMELGNHWDDLKQKAGDAGRILDAETAARLEETNRKLKEMQQYIKGAELGFAEGFTPALERFLDVLTETKSPLEGMVAIGDKIARSFAAVASVMYSAAAASAVLGAAAVGGPLTAAGRQAGEDALRFDQKSREMADLALGPSAQQGNTQRAIEGVGSTGIVGMGGVKVGTGSGVSSGKGFEGIGDLGAGEKANKAAELKLKAMEEELNEEKLQFGLTLKAEYDFWDARRNVFQQGSEQYNQIVQKQAQLAVEGARLAHEKLAKVRAEQLKDDKDAYNAMVEATKGAGAQYLTRMQGVDRMDALKSQTADQSAKAQDAQREALLRLAAPGIEARGLQAIHANDYERQRQDVTSQQQRDDAAAARQITVLNTDRTAVAGNAGITAQERQKQLDAIDEEIAKIHESSAVRNEETKNRLAALKQDQELRAQEDARRVESTTLLGGLNDALRQFVQTATDGGAQMKQWFTDSLNSTNSAIVKQLTEPSWQTRGQWGNVGKGIFAEATGDLLKHAEGSTLAAFGIGGKADGTSESTAWWVRITGGKGAGGSSDSGLHLPGMGHEWGGGDVKSILAKYDDGDGPDLSSIPDDTGVDDSSGDDGDGTSGIAMKTAGLMAKIEKFLGFKHGSDSGAPGGGMGKLSSLIGGGANPLGTANGTSEANALWVRVAGTAGSGIGGGGGYYPGSSTTSSKGGGGGLFGGLSSLLGGGDGGDLSMVADGGAADYGAEAGMLAGFADGTDNAPGGAAWVGEEGPEIVNLPRGSQVVPNKKLNDYLGGGGGGDTHHHHWNIDATGSTDPAAVHAAATRAVRAAMPQIHASVMNTIDQRKQRMPASRG